MKVFNVFFFNFQMRKWSFENPWCMMCSINNLISIQFVVSYSIGNQFICALKNVNFLHQLEIEKRGNKTRLLRFLSNLDGDFRKVNLTQIEIAIKFRNGIWIDDVPRYRMNAQYFLPIRELNTKRKDLVDRLMHLVSQNDYYEKLKIFTSWRALSNRFSVWTSNLKRWRFFLGAVHRSMNYDF